MKKKTDNELNNTEADLDAIAPDTFTPVLYINRGKDEMNLAEFPIARLGRRDTRLAIEYEGQVVDKTGGVLKQKWIVSGSSQVGLPTEFAERVLISLIALTAEHRFQSRKVPFTIYRVLKMLNLSTNQRNYKAVEKALDQLVGVTIYSEGAFWDHAEKRRVTTKKAFHLVEEYWLKSLEGDKEVIKAEGVNGYIVWGERMWRSFEAGYIKNLNIDFYYQLESALSRRLYRFLDKRMHYQNAYEIDIFDLAARLGMTAYRYPSDIAHKLKPAITELKDRGYLDAAEVVKVGKFKRMSFVRAEAGIPSQPSLWDALDAPKPVKGTGVQKRPEEPVAALYERYSTSEDLKQVWDSVLADVQVSLPRQTYETYHIGDTYLLAIEEDLAVLAVPKLYLDWHEYRMTHLYTRSLNRLLETEITRFRFEVI